MFKKLSNIGDCGIVCDFGDEVNQKINAGVIKLFHYVRQQVSEGKFKRDIKLHSLLQQTNYKF